MDRAAKNTAIAIIVILVLLIGIVWYAKFPKINLGKKERVLLTATSSPNPNLEFYSLGKSKMNEILAEQLDEIAAGETTQLPSREPTSIPAVYKLSALKITSDNSTSSLRRYGLSLVAALKPYQTDRDSEIALMLAALAGKDPAKAAELAAAAATEKRVIANLLAILVPRSAMNLHLALINHLSIEAALVSDMSKILDNPYLALQSADMYRVKKLSFYDDVAKINAFFQENGLVFTREEAGNIYKY